MFQSKRKILIVLVVMFAASGVQAKEWLDEMLVHRAPAFTGENPENCLVCHSGERMRSIADGAHGNTKDNRAPFGNNGCESCHGPASIHVSRAHGGKGFPPLIGFGYTKVASPRDQQVDACMYCHSGSQEGMDAIPFEGTTHDKWIVTCSSCHQVHAEEDPVLTRSTQAKVCYTCHAEQEEGHQKVGRRVPDFNRMGCAGCHKVHRLPKNQQ